ncbi:MAG: hypothetical protein Kow0042_27710 [Calditrichia bacterium]
MNVIAQNPEEKIEAALQKLSLLHRALLWEQAKKEGLSPIQIQFLLYLSQSAEEVITIGQLAKKFLLTPATVSDAVKVLKQKNLIEKSRHSSDRRRQSLFLTDRGREITARLSKWNQKIIEQIKQFSLQMQDTVIIFLLELFESLKKIDFAYIIDTCLSCRHFQKNVYPTPDEQHLCLYRKQGLSNLDLRIDCPNYKTKLSV